MKFRVAIVLGTMKPLSVSDESTVHELYAKIGQEHRRI